MSHTIEVRSTLQDRVSNYLGGNPERRNSFMAEAETAQAIEEAGVCNVDMSEYLEILERAKEELRAAQEKVDRLQRLIDTQQ